MTLVVSFTSRDFFYTVAFYVISHRLFSTFFSMAQQPLVGQGLLIIEAAPSLSGILWTNDQRKAETSS